MDYIWLAISVVTLIVAMVLHEKSIKRRFYVAQTEVRENRELDKKIVRLYTEIEELLDNFESYVGEVHEELEASRTELLAMSRQATTLYLQVMQPGVFAPIPQAEEEAEKPHEEPKEQGKPAKKQVSGKKGNNERGEHSEPPAESRSSRLTPRDLAELDKMGSKAQKIRYLTGKGLTLTEVARELKMGKGEIHLILDLDKG